MNTVLRYSVLMLISLRFSKACFAQHQEIGDYLIRFDNITAAKCSYKNVNGGIGVPEGKYLACFTDTFRTYAIVEKRRSGFVAIDRQENELYSVFIFDNGPDYVSDGLFRILSKGKIGYADSATGKIAIAPRFQCAWPFEHGIAKVSLRCTKYRIGGHTYWKSQSWYYINKKGTKISSPQTK